MSQITMRPPKAGMKVSMLGSSYAYARAPLGADTATTWTYTDGQTGKEYSVNSSTGVATEIKADGSHGSVIDIINSGLGVAKGILDTINGSKNTPNPLPPIEKKDNTVLYVGIGAAALVAVLFIAKK